MRKQAEAELGQAQPKFNWGWNSDWLVIRIGDKDELMKNSSYWMEIYHPYLMSSPWGNFITPLEIQPLSESMALMKMHLVDENHHFVGNSLRLMKNHLFDKYSKLWSKLSLCWKFNSLLGISFLWKIRTLLIEFIIFMKMDHLDENSVLW